MVSSALGDQLRMTITVNGEEECAWLRDGKELINVTFWVPSASLSPTRDSQLPAAFEHGGVKRKKQLVGGNMFCEYNGIRPL